MYRQVCHLFEIYPFCSSCSIFISIFIFIGAFIFIVIFIFIFILTKPAPASTPTPPNHHLPLYNLPEHIQIQAHFAPQYTMPFSALALLALLTTAHSAHLPLARIPRRVDQSINPRAEYLGGWAWSTSDVCSGAWSESCGTSNNSCCPTGETCFKTGYGPYCCPTGPSPPDTH